MSALLTNITGRGSSTEDSISSGPEDRELSTGLL